MPNHSSASTVLHARKPTTARGQATLRRILAAAEQEFGAKGFHTASVAGITQASGVAQGTFYIYFGGKEQIFRELVRDIGEQVRAAMTQAAAEAPDRLAAERAGLEGFIDFVAAHPHLYRIVQEAQFVDEQVYRDYYNDIARGYANALQQAAEVGEIRAGDAELQAWALMGLGHFVGLRYCVWQGRRPTAATLDAAMDFISHGLAPVAD